MEKIDAKIWATFKVPQHMMGILPIQGRRADLVIFDDILERDTMETAVNISAPDLREAKRMIWDKTMEGHMLTIDPIEADTFDYNSDRRHVSTKGLNPRVRPTDAFRVRWLGLNGESFVREVRSLKELNECIQPIIREHAANRKLVLQAKAKRAAQEVKERRNQLLAAIGQHEKSTAALKKQLDELE